MKRTFDLESLPAAAELRAAVAELRRIEQERDVLQEQWDACREIEDKGRQEAADLQGLRARRIDLLADELGGADVTVALDEARAAIAAAEPIVEQAGDRAAAAGQVRARVEGKMDALERRRGAATAASRLARYQLLRGAGEIAADRFRVAREKLEDAYGSLCAVLAVGTQEAMAQREADPQSSVTSLCAAHLIHAHAHAAGQVVAPPGSPYFDGVAEAHRAQAGAAVAAAWARTRDELTAQIEALSSEGAE